MAKYLIDVNLPRYFSLWANEDFMHVIDLNDEMKDSEIWTYARSNSLTIVTKDADFSDNALISNPPPWVIHIKVGNMKMRDFHQFLATNWREITEISQACRLVRVYRDRIEGIE